LRSLKRRPKVNPEKTEEKVINRIMPNKPSIGIVEKILELIS